MTPDKVIDRSNVIKPTYVEGKPFIFVSYSKQDTDRVQPILKALKKGGYYFWYDEEIPGGAKFAAMIGERIEECCQLMVLITPNSVASEYVEKEVAMAVDSKKNIFAVHLEETKLPHSLKLLLSNVNQLFKSRYSVEDAFIRIIMESVSKKAHGCIEEIATHIIPPAIFEGEDLKTYNKLIEACEKASLYGLGFTNDVYEDKIFLVDKNGKIYYAASQTKYALSDIISIITVDCCEDSVNNIGKLIIVFSDGSNWILNNNGLIYNVSEKVSHSGVEECLEDDFDIYGCFEEEAWFTKYIAVVTADYALESWEHCCKAIGHEELIPKFDISRNNRIIINGKLTEYIFDSYHWRIFYRKEKNFEGEEEGEVYIYFGDVIKFCINEKTNKLVIRERKNS